MFADDSNVFSRGFYQEAQKVQWVGAAAVGIMVQHGFTETYRGGLLNGDPTFKLAAIDPEGNKKRQRMAVQGPVCSKDGTLVGWHTMPHSPHEILAGVPEYSEGGDNWSERRAMVWTGFVFDSRLVWDWDKKAPWFPGKDGEPGAEARELPRWVRRWEEWPAEREGRAGRTIKAAQQQERSDLLARLVLDESYVQPMGDCGGEVLAWWLRVEARADSKFYSRQAARLLFLRCCILCCCPVLGSAIYQACKQDSQPQFSLLQQSMNTSIAVFGRLLRLPTD